MNSQRRFRESPSQRRVRILLALVEAGRATTRELSTKLGIAQRTVRQDLKHLSEVAPIAPEGERRERRWSFHPERRTKYLGILDRIALELGRQATAFLSGTALEPIRDVRPLDDIPGPYARNLDRKLRFKEEPARNYGPKRDLLDQVLDGLLRERALRLDYHALDGPRRYDDLVALTLVVYKRAVYLLCRERVNGALSGPIRRLAVDRFVNIEVGDAVDYPRDWNPDTDLSPYFGIGTGDGIDQIVLEFTPKVATFVRARLWHPTQRLETLPNEGVRLSMSTGGPELIPFILEWGAECTVVAPTKLREVVVQQLRKNLAQYVAVGGVRMDLG